MRLWIALAAALALPLFGPRAPRRPPRFATARPGYAWRFPRDAGAHPAFANEWWYFTGNLRGSHGHRFGFELTFFRISPFPGATLRQDIYFAHFAVSDLTAGRFFFHVRARRGLWGQAGVGGSPLRIWNVNWRARFGPRGPRLLAARWGGFAVHLVLHPGRPPRRMFNGPDGYSRKGPAPSEASEYYSLPRLPAAGTITAAGRRFSVRGAVWMDHEFATDQLAPSQIGWDWMGLQFDPVGRGSSPDRRRTQPAQAPSPTPPAPRDLLLFQLRDRDGKVDPYSAGTLRTRHGDASLLARQFEMLPLRIWRSPATGGRYPVVWRLRIPSRHLRLTVTAALDDQELRARAPMAVDYWEGAVRVSGRWRGRPIRGVGYLEMTGYSHPFAALHSRGNLGTH
ncbi:MAG: lipocalin-like domain-containing protein [Terriglobales bacterium]